MKRSVFLEYVAKGLCPYCKEHTAFESGKKRCSACLQRDKLKQQRTRRSEEYHVKLEDYSHRGLCWKCTAHNPLNTGKSLCDSCLSSQRNHAIKRYHCSVLIRLKCKETSTDRRLRIKKLCFESYGGCRCLNCKITDMAVLSLDHVNNDGAAERKILNSIKDRGCGSKFYDYLYKNNFPDKDRYQVLCMNCQFLKRANGGILKAPSWAPIEISKIPKETADLSLQTPTL